MNESSPGTISPTDDSVTSLRGAAAVGVGRRFWMFAGSIALVVAAVVLVVTFVSATNDNARITRMKDHGIPVVVKVSDCIGNLGGSGSNASSYTCTGDYAARGDTYHEVIGAMTFFAAPGTHVRAVADPSRPSTVELASAVATSKSSVSKYVVPGLLAVLFLSLLAAFLRLLRRPRLPSPRPATFRE
jgi:hypothetical protein